MDPRFKRSGNPRLDYPDYWWETPVEREERMKTAKRPARSGLAWYDEVDWVVLVISVAIIAGGLLWGLWEMTQPPYDPCGVRCSDARP